MTSRARIESRDENGMGERALALDSPFAKQDARQPPA
jgi:hypothetical protein